MRTATEPAHDAWVTGPITGDAPHGQAHGIDVTHRYSGVGLGADSPRPPAER